MGKDGPLFPSLLAISVNSKLRTVRARARHPDRVKVRARARDGSANFNLITYTRNSNELVSKCMESLDEVAFVLS